MKCKYCFSSCLSPLVLARSHGSYLQLLLLCCLPAGDFLVSSFLLRLLTGILQGRGVPLPHGFIQLFRSVWSPRYFLLWARIQYRHYSSCCSNGSSFGRWELVQVGLCGLGHTPIIFGVRPCFLAVQDAPGYLVFSLLQS